MANFHDAFLASAAEDANSDVLYVCRGLCFIGWLHYTDLLDQRRRARFAKVPRRGAGKSTQSGSNRNNISSLFLPFNWVQTYKCSPGDRVAAVSNDGVAGTLTVTELS